MTGPREGLDLTHWRQTFAGLDAEVWFDPVSRGIYATDASHYQQQPLVVVAPRHRQAAIEALRLAHRASLPVTARGAATSLSGQTFGYGMILDLSRHLRGIDEPDLQTGTVRVEPGVVRDELNEALKAHAVHFAPDPATGNRATIGGMVGNNTSGTRSIVYGKTIDHVLACTVALADGTVIECQACSPHEWQARCRRPGREGELYRGVRRLVEEHADEIRARFPRVLRRVSGYNLDEFVPDAGYTGPIGPRAGQQGREDWNLSHLIVGSEGTLAVLLDITLRLTPLPRASSVVVAHFRDTDSALRAVPAIDRHGPSAVELLDGIVLAEARINPSTRAMADFVEGEPGAVLLIERFAADSARAGADAEALATDLAAQGIGYAWPWRCDPAGQQRIWQVRKLGLGLISNVPGPVKGQACIEDACVPIEDLADYIAGLERDCQELGLRYSLYAHASVGVIHFRPMLDLHRPEHRQAMEILSRRAFDRCQALGGSFAGEHGDGIVRGQYVAEAFGPVLAAAFRQVKELFDPDGRLNPGKIIDPPPMTDPAILRYGDAYRPQVPETRFHYRDQGSFQALVEQCNGVGACRKTASGTMCPSYMATGDERHSTRGRANALRLALSGQLGRDPRRALSDDDLAQVLELCLSCKACAGECPNTVDLSRLKAEVWQWRHDRYGAPLGARLIGDLPDHLPLLATPPGRALLRLGELPGLRHLRQLVTGIDHRRRLPLPAARSLHTRLRDETATTSPGTGEQVLLFADTYAQWYEPDVALAARRLLHDAGFAVDLVHPGCCQRPRLSQGLLDDARRHGAATMAALDRLGGGTAPIVCLEPSCASALAHDLPDLIDDAACGRRVAGRIVLLDRFLADRSVPLEATAAQLVVHTHCHQRALFGTDRLQPTGADCERLDAGCCGMAGAFGYQHHDLSVAVAEDRLLPAVRRAVAQGSTIIADGISCRHQLADLAGVRAHHWAEVVRVRHPSSTDTDAPPPR